LSWRRKLVFAGFSLLLFLLLAEGGLRARSYLRYGGAGTEVSDRLRVLNREIGIYELVPGAEVKSAKLNVKINSLGFRGPEIALEKPAGVVRIACLGASTTYCAEVPNEATWPARLQEILARQHPEVRFEVVNAAVPGYVSSDCLKALQHKVLPLEPDLVIYYEADNEFARDTRRLAQERGLLAAGGGNVPGWARALSRLSLLFDLAYKNASIALSQSVGKDGKLEGLPGDLPRNFLAEIDRIRSELSAREIPLVLSTFSVKYRRSQDRATQVSNADVAFYYMPWMTIDELLNAVDLYNEAIREHGRKHGIPVIEGHEEIPADSEHFADCMHFADAGCARMAERMARGLEASGVLPRAIERCKR